MNPNRQRREEIEPEIRPRFGVIQGGGESNDERGSLESAENSQNQTSEQLADAERKLGVIQGGGESTDERGSLRSVNDDEQTVPNTFGWQPSNTNQNQSKQSFVSKASRLARKKGPLSFIGGLIAAGFALIAFFGGPSLLLVNMAEVFANALDQQHPVLDTRYRKIVVAKLDNKTKGICSSVASFKCKYGSFSERELKKLRSNGIEVLGEDGKSLLNNDGTIRERGARAASMTHKGKTITANQYQRELRRNPSFRSANILSMNTKFMGMYDKVFNNYFNSIRASKADVFKDAASDDERDEILRENTKNGAPDGALADRPVKDDPCNAACEEKYQRDTERADALDQISADAQENADKNIRNAQPGKLDKIASIASPVGAVGDVCTIPYAIDAVGMGAKVIRNVQMVRYAASALAVADSIKAGKANQGSVSFWSNLLTKTMRDKKTGKETLAATDSFAYRHAAYGDKGLTESASYALGAGGLGGKLEGLADKIYGNIPGGKSTCKALNNPFVQGAALLTNIIPGVGIGGKAVTPIVKEIIQKAMSALVVNVAQDKAMSLLLGYIINIGIDMVSGTGVDSSNMYGELAGDWIGSGTEEMFSAANGLGGALPLTPEQAAAQDTGNQQVAADYTSAQSSIAHPLDGTNPYSLVGLTYQRMLSTTGSITGMSSLLLAPQKLFAGGINLLSPSASAKSPDDYQQCEDYRYRDSNIATTPLCHVVRGLPAPYKDLDPRVITQSLFDKGQVDETGAPVGEDYIKFIENCFSNLIPGDDSEGGDGGDCQIKESDSQEQKDRKGYYATHFVDERLTDIAENGLPTEDEATESTQGGSTLRLATFNIYHSDGQSNEVWTKRLERSIDVLKTESITVAGLQEARPDQQRKFKNLAGDTYAIYPAETAAGGTDGFTPNPIVWNKNSFDLVPESGQLRAITYDGKQLRHLAIVKLQDKLSGQQFWVMNTHDPADVRDGNTAQQRVDNARLYVKTFEELSADGIPVYMTGDFNNRYSIGGGNGPLGGLRENLTYCIITNNGKVWDAWDAAQSKSGPCPSDNAGPAKNAVDHIFITKDGISNVSNFQISPMGKDKNGSDSHDTIFVDIAIAGAEGEQPPLDVDDKSFIAGAYNILHETHMANNIKTRAKTVAEVIKGSLTNNVPFGITSLEEISPNQYNLLKKELPDYRLFPATVPNNQGVAVMWNARQFELLESGYVTGTYNNIGEISDISKPWVKLKSASGKIVYYLGIHSPNNDFGTVAMRTENGKKFLDWARSKARGSDLVVVAGDFNRSGNIEYSKEGPAGRVGAYCELTSGAIMQHVSDAVRGVNPNESCPSGASAIPIDQIYMSLNAGVKASKWQQIGKNKMATTGTDHSPAFVTLEFAK